VQKPCEQKFPKKTANFIEKNDVQVTKHCQILHLYILSEQYAPQTHNSTRRAL